MPTIDAFLSNLRSDLVVSCGLRDYAIWASERNHRSERREMPWTLGRPSVQGGPAEVVQPHVTYPPRADSAVVESAPCLALAAALSGLSVS